ncbi:distal tail protein Dit [Inconstantimicrobium mannanitabidum]|uniref:Uncharacterized protein n=1 Tax=Inconstantimicrobium mannanitabidum TaxID=1604901 RepID=A0ACB5R9D6_9CLOT|nr:distal tail protein Dit [Clostridium sp. TW13]GKX65651.1 hypothetical protein rsdtw13_09090 [Clostridium sp. TW13]
MFFVYFNGKRDLDLGIKTIKRPSIPIPKKRYKTTTVSGKDGDYYTTNGEYEDITIPVDFNFIDRTNFHAKCRQIDKWLNKIKDYQLKFSDDLGVFYKVKKIECDEIERVYKVLGKFTVKFTCDPYAWLVEGQQSITLNGNNIINDFEATKPIYIINAEGLITLKVNGKEVTINVGQQVTINTELQLCFKNKELINLALKTGKFEDLYLNEGINTIEYSVGTSGTLASIQLIPNWKTL